MTFVKSNSKTAWLFIVLFIGCSIYGLNSLNRDSMISNDAAQYISVAKNYLQGKGFSTSIIFYDVQHRFGYIPAPQTVFPNGYPFLISLITFLGISPQYAAFLLSLVCFNFIGFFIFLITRSSGHRDLICLTLTGIWYSFVPAWFNVLSCGSEMSFIFFTMIGLGCIIMGEKTKRKLFLFLTSASAAISFTIRYVGIFYILSLFIFFFIGFLREKSRESLYELLLVVGLPFFTVINIIGKNYLITSSIRGSAIYPLENSITDGLQRLYNVLFSLFGFSKEGLVNLTIPNILLTFFCFALVIFLIFEIKKIKVDKINYRNMLAKTVPLFSITYVTISFLFLTYFNFTAVAPLNSRYLIPLIPYCLILLADLRKVFFLNDIIAKKSISFFYWGIIIVFLCGQSNVYAWRWKNSVEKNKFAEMKYALQKPFQSDSLFEFLAERVIYERPLLGNDPQLLGAILDRPVVGLPEIEYCNKIWTFNEVKKTVKKFNITYVIFFRDIFFRNSYFDSNQVFFKEISKGIIPPWLKVIFSDEKVILFQVYRQSSLLEREMRALN